MPPKRPASSPANVQHKKSRKSLNLDMKLGIISRHEGGEGANYIARALSLSQSTVSTVIKNKDSIRKAGQVATTMQAKTLTRHREPIFEEMERCLSIWIRDETAKSMPLNMATISRKAIKLFEKLKEEGWQVKEGTQFTASKGWFDRFKNRAGLHNVKTTGEAASADKEAAESFLATLKKRIEDGGYSPHQVINYDETGLYWKRMSGRTFIFKEEKQAPGFKVSKDRLTLSLGGNAAGDLKLKPLLIYHSENPRALKGYNKKDLPVIWRSNKKGWMTTAINQDYVGSLSSELAEYAKRKNLDNKFLLLVDNCPSHPPAMEDWADNIEVLFTPPNTTALIQPMDQGIIATFKAYYQRRTMQQLIDGTDGEGMPTIKQWWSAYNIKKGIYNIDAAWKEVTPQAMNGCWRKIWPEVVHDFKGFDVQAVRGDIVKLSHTAGFTDVDEQDVQELLDSHDQPLSVEDLLQMQEQRALAEDEEEEEEDESRGLTLAKLREVLNGVDTLMGILQDADPNTARSANAVQATNDALKIYREIYQHKKQLAKQSVITSFFKPVSQSGTTSPPASTSSDPATPSTSKASLMASFFTPRPSSSPKAGPSSVDADCAFNPDSPLPVLSSDDDE